MNEKEMSTASASIDLGSEQFYVDGVHAGSPAFKMRTAMIERFNVLSEAWRAGYTQLPPMPMHVAVEIKRELHVVGNALWPDPAWIIYEKPK
jgi:hypothetical protein